MRRDEQTNNRVSPSVYAVRSACRREHDAPARHCQCNRVDPRNTHSPVWSDSLPTYRRMSPQYPSQRRNQSCLSRRLRRSVDSITEGSGMTTCVNTETCAYFLFDEDHPTYGELCGCPATREFTAFGSSFPVC